MGRPLGSLAKDILVVVGALAEAYFESPLGSPGNLSRWVYGNYRRPAVPYGARFYQTVRRLEQGGYIRRSANHIELSPEGHKAIRRISFEHHTLATPPWDGVWRIIIWDIPEHQRTLRNRVRRLLKRLGVVQIQQSVWVTPHPCRDEVQLLREEIGIEQGLLYLEATIIEGQKKLEQHFGLKQ